MINIFFQAKMGSDSSIPFRSSMELLELRVKLEDLVNQEDQDDEDSRVNEEILVEWVKSENVEMKAEQDSLVSREETDEED
jgi:hypothetical protein